MVHHRKLPVREKVFVHSLMYHGYRYVQRRHDLKYKKGYVIPATKREDASGTDFWVKMPGHRALIPIQITQRGVTLFKKYSDPTPAKFQEFVAYAEKRVRQKRFICRRDKIAFVLVRDFDGIKTNKTLAWGDVKALRYGIAHYRP